MEKLVLEQLGLPGRLACGDGSRVPDAAGGWWLLRKTCSYLGVIPLLARSQDCHNKEEAHPVISRLNRQLKAPSYRRDEVEG